jgi:hypothetical protein
MLTESDIAKIAKLVKDECREVEGRMNARYGQMFSPDKMRSYGQTLAKLIDGRVQKLAGTMSYEGVYEEGKSYKKGQFVTFGGSLWHCNAPTSIQPGIGSSTWVLAVKKGRDAR